MTENARVQADYDVSGGYGHTLQGLARTLADAAEAQGLTNVEVSSVPTGSLPGSHGKVTINFDRPENTQQLGYNELVRAIEIVRADTSTVWVLDRLNDVTGLVADKDV